jgi:hypothetical protein
MASITGSPVTDGTLGIHREVIAKRLARVQYNDDDEKRSLRMKEHTQAKESINMVHNHV